MKSSKLAILGAIPTLVIITGIMLLEVDPNGDPMQLGTKFIINGLIMAAYFIILWAMISEELK